MSDGEGGEYLLGHSEAERRRLLVQARLLAPITRRFFEQAGIVPGMQVLDVGSGMGDVALLAAGLVGAAGAVVGTDLAPDAVEAARARAGPTTTFLLGDPTRMRFAQPFDAVVGRYVLMYQPDPAASLRALARALRPGGVMVFHELDWGGARSYPPAPTYDRCCRWVAEGLLLGGAEAHMGTKLHRAFRDAGLPPPAMRLEAIAGGPEDPSGVVQDLLETIFPPSLLATLERHGEADAGAIDPDSLPQRMADEIACLGSVVVCRSEFGAWTRLPSGP